MLRLLADQPPDRVGVTRTLRLGHTLKMTPSGGYELDLSEPGLHKTSAVFGATKTSINSSLEPSLDSYIELFDIQPGGYLFARRGDPSQAVSLTNWSRLVKKIFARHGDVALCPKDARSSFITFLLSGDHGDEAVKAAAVAMRHNSKTQASVTYNRGGCNRRVAAAMRVAATHSAKFSASSSGCK